MADAIICLSLVSKVREIFGSGHLLRKGGRVCLRIQRCRWWWLACGGGNAQGVQWGGYKLKDGLPKIFLGG